MAKYMSVCLPIDLLGLIDRKIKGERYTSRADFVKQAIRLELERLEKNECGS